MYQGSGLMLRSVSNLEHFSVIEHQLNFDVSLDVPIADLQNIISRIPTPQFITQEVYYGSGDIEPSQYQVIGDVTE